MRLVVVGLVLAVAGIDLSGILHGVGMGRARAVEAETMTASAPSAAETLEVAPETLEEEGQAAPRQLDPPGFVRLPHPVVPDGPRRVGIQAGHWLTQIAPPELGRIIYQTGTSWNGFTEVEVNLDVAHRVADILRAEGFEVDVLATTIPPGYLADAFIALHADGDGTSAKSGFKLAHSSRRTPLEERLMSLVAEEYGNATGLEYDADGVTRNMLGYYAMNWSRIRYSTSAFTPSVILEMGFLSNDWDRQLMIDQPNLLASAIAAGIRRFLEETPRAKMFGSDLLVTRRPQRPPFPSTVR